MTESRRTYDRGMASPRRAVGHGFLSGYRGVERLRSKAFSIAASGAFAGFGAGSALQPPVRLDGERRIAIGAGVWVGADSWLHVEGDDDGPVALRIGDGTSIAGHCVLSAVREVTVGARVLIARGVYVADHSHAFSSFDVAIRDQGIDRIAAVDIGDGAWLAENVVVLPGVRIGRGAVVGANSVVTQDVPPGAVAAGAPARIVRRRGPAVVAATVSDGG